MLVGLAALHKRPAERRYVGVRPEQVVQIVEDDLHEERIDPWTSKLKERSEQAEHRVAVLRPEHLGALGPGFGGGARQSLQRYLGEVS